MKCIHIDGFVNTCIFDMFKSNVSKILSLTNYIIQKAQQMLKDHYLFHKASTKLVKSKQYKAWRGANNEVPDYTLPASYHVDHWEKEMEKIKQAAKMMNPNYNPMDEFKKEDVKMPTQENMTKTQEKEGESNIRIPGLTD